MGDGLPVLLLGERIDRAELLAAAPEPLNPRQQRLSLLLIERVRPGGDGLVAVRPNGQGDLSPSQVAWKRKKGVPNRSSLLLIGDRLYMITEIGVLSCIEAESGRDIGEGRLQGPFFASPVYADGHLYFFNREGKGYVVHPGPELKVLATNQLSDGCMASPAVAGKALFVRTLTHLYCIEKQ